MKTRIISALAALSFLLSASLPAATVTGRSALGTLAGTEKIPIDDGGVDKYILVSTLRAANVLTGGLTASGSTAFDFSGSTGAFLTSTGVNTFGGSAHTFASTIKPATNDVGSLGTSALAWSDLFLASGAVINFDNGDAVITHSTGILTVSTGDLRVTTAGTNSASAVTVGGTQTLAAKTLTSPVIATGLTASGSASNDFSGSSGSFKSSTGLNIFGGSTHSFAGKLFPATDDGAALGDTTHHFSDLFLATGSVLNFQNGNVAVTHSSGILTMGTGELRITTPGTNAASVPTLGSTSTMTNKSLTAPVIVDGLTASGSTSNDFSASTGTFKTSTGATTLGSTVSVAGKVFPATDDGAPLGDTTHNFSDIFLATGAVLNYANGNVAVTHSSGILTMGTGELRITTAGTNAASVPTLGSTSTLTNKTLTAPVIGGGLTASGSSLNTFGGSSGGFTTSTGANIFSGSSHTFASTITPATDDVGALGTASLQWSDLFLASGALIKFASTDVVLTHSTGILTMSTGELRITTVGTNAASVPTLGSTSTMTNKTLTSPTITGPSITGTLATTGVITQTSASATAFESGLNGGTNPVFRLVNNIASQATGISITGRAAAAGADITVLSSGTDENLVINAKGAGTITLNPTATGNVVIGKGVVTPAVTVASGDGAIAIASGIVVITKGSAAALTLAAPSSQNGTRITVISTTDFAHVITVTGGLWDGTATANTTATFAVVKGASITLVAYGTAWYVESLNAVTPAP